MNAQTTNTAPLLSRENLCKFYRPLGEEIPQQFWEQIAYEGLILPSYLNRSVMGAVVHVVAWESNELLALVANKKDLAHPNKHVGIGVPTEELREGEIPYEVAKGRLMKEELDLTTGFSIGDILTVRIDQRGVIHIVFRATLDEYTEIPKLVNDPDGEIEGAYLVNPFSVIRIHKEDGYPRPKFTPKIGEKNVYFSHLGFVATSLTKM